MAKATTGLARARLLEERSEYLIVLHQHAVDGSKLQLGLGWLYGGAGAGGGSVDPRGGCFAPSFATHSQV